jgi:hypothetical protein
MYFYTLTQGIRIQNIENNFNPNAWPDSLRKKGELRQKCLCLSEVYDDAKLQKSKFARTFRTAYNILASQ